LIGIAERVRDLNGKLKIDSSPGNGTLLEVELPVKESLTT
jgi:signal transduction histidine kinase